MENQEVDGLREVVQKQSAVIEGLTDALLKLRTDTSNFSDEACWCHARKDTESHRLGCAVAKKALSN